MPPKAAIAIAAIRTNIEIEDSYVAITDRYGVRTKTQPADLALRHLAGQPMTEEALAMRGAHAVSGPPPTPSRWMRRDPGRHLPD